MLEVNILEDVEVIRCELLLGIEMVDMFLKKISVSQACMLPLFVMVALLWMVFWEHKTEFF